MAQTENQEVSQENLFKQLEKNDVKVAGEAAEKMKENIQNASSGGAWLGLGIHDVFIEAIELTQAKTGTMGMKFIVENEDGKSEVVFWLSEAALPYTIENVSRLVVHNTAEDKKAEARTFMSNITSAKELLEVAKAKLIGGVAFLSVRESKTNTYTDTKTGEIKPSLERNLLSYKPKDAVEQAAAKVIGGGTTVDPKTKLNIPF